MYNGRFSGRKRRLLRKRQFAVIVSMALLLVGLVGGSLAYLFMSTDDVENTFTPVKVTTDVDETFENNVKSNVKIKNTGDISAYIRAAVIINWQTEDGKVYGEMPVEGTDYTIEYNEEDWTLQGGFWYHKGAVAPGEKTKALIKTCSPEGSGSPDGNTDYKLTVTILGSGIQAKPDDVVTSVWGNVPVN